MTLALSATGPEFDWRTAPFYFFNLSISLLFFRPRSFYTQFRFLFKKILLSQLNHSRVYSISTYLKASFGSRPAFLLKQEKRIKFSVKSLERMVFGQVVIGPPGSGKTTYCNGMSQFLSLIGRSSFSFILFMKFNSLFIII